MGMARAQLVVDAAYDIDHAELPALGGDHRVEEDLKQQVAEFFFEMRVPHRAVACRATDRHGIERVEHFVALFDQVAP